MSSTAAGVRRTERYVYNTLHWGFPILPVLGFTVVTGPAPLEWTIPWAVLTTVAGAAGLAVLHTRLRDAGLLPASGWDVFRLSSLGPATAVWAIASVALALTAPFVRPEETPMAALLAGILGAVTTMPLLAPTAPDRPIGNGYLAGVAGAALAAVVLWLVPPAPTAQTADRFVATYAAWGMIGLLIGFAVMFLHVLVTTRELERARVDSARLAVTEERLRFARDLHDVFGRTLSAVALKAELGAAQAERGHREAAATMREVQTIATDALTEVREVVRGYRQADLAAEISGARSLLEAAGFTVQTVVDAGDLPAPAGRALAWVVREASTNVLRHAHPSSARIVLTQSAGGVSLEITNDAPATPTGAPGSGLAGLTERLREIGGRVDAGRRGEQYVLRATVDAAALDRLRDAERSL